RSLVRSRPRSSRPAGSRRLRLAELDISRPAFDTGIYPDNRDGLSQGRGSVAYRLCALSVPEPSGPLLSHSRRPPEEGRRKARFPCLTAAGFPYWRLERGPL